MTDPKTPKKPKKKTTRLVNRMSIDVSVSLSPEAESLLANISMHLENIAYSLKIMRGNQVEFTKMVGPIMDREMVKTFKDAVEQESGLITEDVNDARAYDQDEQTPDDRELQCPNCESHNIMLHDGHEAISEVGDPSGEGHYHCMECHHIFASVEALGL